MSKYFPKPKSLGGNVKVELHLSNYATKSELKKTSVDTSDFAKEVDLAHLKLNVDKLERVPNYLSSLKVTYIN